MGSEDSSNQGTNNRNFDGLAVMAITAITFSLLRPQFVDGVWGSVLAGGLAGGLGAYLHNMLPINSDGRRIPLLVSVLLIVVGIIVVPLLTA